MPWIALFIAGLLEVAWAAGLKASNGLTRTGPALFTLVTLIGSLWLLASAMKTIPLSTAYPVWTGIGAVGTVILGVVMFREHMTMPRLFFAALILVGIIGLRATHE